MPLNVFNIDENMMIESIMTSLNEAGQRLSDEKMMEIMNDIEEALPGVAEVVAYGMAEKWKEEARDAGGWGHKYAQAIAVREGVDGSFEVYLDDEKLDKGSNKPYFMFAMMMEEGVRSWSIKDAVLKSEKAKTGPTGLKYIVIPFPVSIPRRKGQGKMQNQFGKREMTSEIYKIVKSGGRVPPRTELATGEDITGLTRYNTSQLHSQYGIFRTVSEKSSGWQYPNKSPRPVFPSVLSKLNQDAHEIINEFLRAIVREHT